MISDLIFDDKPAQMKILNSVSNSLDPDQDRHSVGPGLGPNRLQRLIADDRSCCWHGRSKRQKTKF